MDILKAEHLAWDLPDGVGIIKDISFSIESGKLVVVTGPNGGGKTTLAKLIAGIETPSAGHLFFEGEDITKKYHGARETGRGVCLPAAGAL